MSFITFEVNKKDNYISDKSSLGTFWSLTFGKTLFDHLLHTWYREYHERSQALLATFWGLKSVWLRISSLVHL